MFQQAEKIRAVATIRARGLVTDQRGYWLLVRDIDDPESEWVLPGGKPEADEDPSVACVREIREEAGLDVEVGRMLVMAYNEATEDRTLPRFTLIFDCGRVEVDESTDGGDVPDGHHVTRWAPPLNALASMRDDVAAAMTEWWMNEDRDKTSVYVERPAKRPVEDAGAGSRGTP